MNILKKANRKQVSSVRWRKRYSVTEHCLHQPRTQGSLFFPPCHRILGFVFVSGLFLTQGSGFVSWWIIMYDMKNNIKLVASNNFAILRRSRRSVIIHKVVWGFSYLVIFRSCFRSVCCSAAFLLYDQYLQWTGVTTTFSFPSVNTPNPT